VKFYKYHGLGNDYLVMNPAEVRRELTPQEIKLICHRNFGIGSDGILWGPLPSITADFKLRIFNPDASEAEKSGNGLRIFSRYLYDHGFVSEAMFQIETLGGIVSSQVFENGRQIKVEMGQASFDSSKIPVMGESRQVINEQINLNGRDLKFCAVSIGNPHCVLLMDELSEEAARSLGPLIEKDPRFPNRTNVQFMRIIDRQHIQIEIWERGAGYTLASGSSSCAAAAVAFRLGFCDRHIKVHMPGGTLNIFINGDYFLEMIGPVVRIAEGSIDGTILENSF